MATKPEVRAIGPDATAIGRGNSAIVVGVSSDKKGQENPPTSYESQPQATQPVTTATTQVPNDQYKTEFIKVYQDAGVIGVAMLTLLALCVLLALFASRILKMYIAMIASREKAEELRLQFFQALTTTVTEVSADVKQLSNDLRSDHKDQDLQVTRIGTILDGMSQRLDSFVFKAKGDQS